MVSIVLFALASGTVIAQSGAAPAADNCGELVTVATHGSTTTRYALAPTQGAPVQGAPIALVLLVGGGGNINLDDKGCPRSLTGNVLMRMRPAFHGAGMATVLVDAPSDYFGGDGLGGFRIAPQHAEDLGRVIADVRERTKATVWVVGHSRGTISAANAAMRLAGAAAPDGLLLLSAMMVGDSRAQKLFAAQTVFDVRLEAIQMPLLAIGHAADNCVRSPSPLMEKIVAGTRSVRKQAVIVAGGSIAPGRAPNLAACEVGEPHDFVGQNAEVAAGIVRFVRGGSY